MTRSASHRLPNRASPVALCVAIAVAAACSPSPSQAPVSTGGPAPSDATSSAVPRPSPSSAEPGPDIVLRPVDGAPLDAAIVRSLVATPSGFAVLGVGSANGPATFTLLGSSDGRRWSRVATGPSGPAFSFLAGGPLGWIASSSEANGTVGATALWFSTDGVAWDRVADGSGPALADLSNSETNPLSAGSVGFAIVGQLTEAGNSVNATWVSRDGRTWAEATALHGRNTDRVLPLPEGFLAFAGGCCAGPGTALFSADGQTWRDLTTDPGSPFDANTGQSLIAAVGSSLVVLRSGDGGAIETFSGDTAQGAGGAGIAWRHEASTDAAFDGAGLSIVTGAKGGALALGFDRTTLAPLAWTSADGAEWHRTALDVNLFGGGVPGLAATSGDDGASFVAIADRSNNAGDVRPQLWRSDDGNAWLDPAGDALGALPAGASVPCPTSRPTEVEEFLAIDPPLWPVCFGDAAIRVRGFIAECECGGITSEQGMPSWLIDPLGFSAFYLSGPIVSAATGPGGFGVKIDPAHSVTVPPPRTHVELTGHFDDPAAATCRVVPLAGAFGPVAPMAQTVALCRRAFVVTQVRRLP